MPERPPLPERPRRKLTNVVIVPLIFGCAIAAAGTAGLVLLRRRPRLDLRGKVVLITGGSRGLGLALARKFAARGAHLALCARSPEELERARRDLSGVASRIVTQVCDVGDQEQVRAFIHTVVSEFGHIDILVNNAGIISVGPV